MVYDPHWCIVLGVQNAVLGCVVILAALVLYAGWPFKP